jgi:hypothetical protein
MKQLTDFERLYEEAKLAFSPPKRKILDIYKYYPQNKSLDDWIDLWNKLWRIDYQLQACYGKDANEIDKKIKEIYKEFTIFIAINSIDINNIHVIYCKHKANEILGEVYFYSYKDKEIKGKTKENYLNKALEYLQQAVIFTPYIKRPLDTNKDDIYLLLVQEFVNLSKGSKFTHPLETMLRLLGERDLIQPIKHEHDKQIIEVLSNIYLQLSDIHSENANSAWDLLGKVNQSEENIKKAKDCYALLKSYYETERNIASISDIKEKITQVEIITTKNQVNLADQDCNSCIKYSSRVAKSDSKRRKLNTGERQKPIAALTDHPAMSHVDRIMNRVTNQIGQSSLSQAATSLVK